MGGSEKIGKNRGDVIEILLKYIILFGRKAKS
jgi:hypothetical protein